MKRNMLDIIKTEAEFAKLAAETAKLNREGRWYPVAVASALMGAGAVLMGAFLALSKFIAG